MNLLKKKSNIPIRRYKYQQGDSATAAGSDAASSTQTAQVATALDPPALAARKAERQLKCKRLAKHTTVHLSDLGLDESVAHEAEVTTVALAGMMAQSKYDQAHPKPKQKRWSSAGGSAQGRNPSASKRQQTSGASPSSQQGAGASSSSQVATDTSRADGASSCAQVATDTSRARALLADHSARRAALEATFLDEALFYIRFRQS